MVGGNLKHPPPPSSASISFANIVLLFFFFLLLTFPGLDFLCVKQSFQMHYLPSSLDNRESLLQFLGKAADTICYYLFYSFLLLHPPWGRKTSVHPSSNEWVGLLLGSFQTPTFRSDHSRRRICIGIPRTCRIIVSDWFTAHYCLLKSALFICLSPHSTSKGLVNLGYWYGYPLSINKISIVIH